MADTRIVLNRAGIYQVFNSPNGETGKYLDRRGKLIVAAAKRQVGVDTGALRASIKMRHITDPRGQGLWIGSQNRIALIHHEGTRRHEIRPKRAKVLRFHAGGRVIYSHRVMHPGTRPNRYLSDNLILVRA